MGTPVQKLFDLTGRTALVTGGSRGLGFQVAEALGDAGARLCLTARNAEELENAATRIGSRGCSVNWVAADAREPVEVERVCAEALRLLGHVDILVNNAGSSWGAPAEEHPLHAWDKVMALNVRGVFLFSQCIAKHSMIPRGKGRILMMASIAGIRGNSSDHLCAAYNASKGAVVSLTRALAGEWGKYGITVNALAPGFFPSRMSNGLIERLGADNLVARTPLRRFGDEDDLKGAAVLLASDAGKHITGHILAIDGGASAVVG